MSMSGDTLHLGRGGIVGNGKFVALCFDTFGMQDTICILNDPILTSSSLTVNTEFYEHRSGFGGIHVPDMIVPINHSLEFDLHLVGSRGQIFTDVEKGFKERLLTEDITTAQLIRLVREKLEKREI